MNLRFRPPEGLLDAATRGAGGGVASRSGPGPGGGDDRMSAGGGDERILRESGGGIMFSVGSMPSWIAGSDAGMVASDEISVSSGYLGVSTFFEKDTSEGKLAFDDDVDGLPLPSSEIG